jgi:hypothetical protein
MADNIIHFKSAKKQASYKKKESQAAKNRVKFGQSKAEKQLENSKKDKLAKHVDDHELDT